jgi:hypothetical protein
MRASSGVSLYEFLVITVMLQNTVVRRSVSMLQALFERYGTRVTFGGRTLWAFWDPTKRRAHVLFGGPRSLRTVERTMRQRYDEDRALAFHYLFTDLFWRHQARPIQWLRSMIRL